MSIGEQIERARLERRSALYRWLYKNYEELAPVLNATRPPWSATAVAFARSKGGKTVTRQAVRETWPKVVASKAKATQTGLPAVRNPTPVTVHPPASQDEDRPTYEPRHRFSGKTPTYRNPFKKDDK